MARIGAPPLWTGRISGPNQMSDLELGWVAGILEGEGCFFVTTRKTAKYGPYVYARVTVCMTDRDIIERLQHVTGVGVLERCASGRTRSTSQSHSGSSVEIRRQSS